MLTLTCDGCGVRTEAECRVQPRGVPRALVGDCFGLPLLLQAPCAGHTLGAFNTAHPAYLKGYLAADLRERRPGAPGAAAPNRLTLWLKQAKHRAEALRAVDRLERLLIEG